MKKKQPSKLTLAIYLIMLEILLKRENLINQVLHKSKPKAEMLRQLKVFGKTITDCKKFVTE